MELDGGLQMGRWYASNQILPDGTQIVVGGRGVNTVEYVPANGRGTYNLPLLAKVRKSILTKVLFIPNSSPIPNHLQIQSHLS